MKLHIVDILIICAYLMVIVAIGLFLKKKAAKNMDSYFLGGKSLPFYMFDARAQVVVYELAADTGNGLFAGRVYLCQNYFVQ